MTTLHPMPALTDLEVKTLGEMLAIANESSFECNRQLDDDDAESHCLDELKRFSDLTDKLLGGEPTTYAEHKAMLDHARECQRERDQRV